MSSTAIIGAQWGDEGKGKLIDYLAGHADVVVRAQGGNNAGHTVVVGDKKYTFHLMPSGVLYEGTLNIIGNGVAFDPEGFLQEVETLKNQNVDISTIRIDERAHMIFPYHKKIDELEEEARKDQEIGTTRRGIGPCYMDKIQRSGIRVGDLLNIERLETLIYQQVEKKNELLKKIYHSEGFDPHKVFETYCQYSAHLKEYITDTTVLLYDALKNNKKVLFEGAQGTLLDVDLGTYPYVTSSHPTSAGFCIGSGIGPNALDEILGVVKAYSTRVGKGPFPTEQDNDIGEAIREKGHEFGSTTGRPRRCGWLDGVIMKYAVRVNGLTGITLMLMDVLDQFDEIQICTAYEIEGEETQDFPANLEKLAQCRPVYRKLKGWKTDITGIQEYEDLPQEAKAYVEAVEEITGVPVKMISVGPDRDQTIVREVMI